MSRQNPDEEPVYNGCGGIVIGVVAVLAILIILIFFSGLLDATPVR